MRLDNIDINNNFGWNPAVHAKITKAALAHVPSLSQYEQHIVKGATGRKFFMRFFGVLDEHHCYSGQQYSGFTVPAHALDVYKNKLADAMIDFDFGNDKLALTEIGEALHVLQDIADPVHTRNVIVAPFRPRTLKNYYARADKVDIAEIMTEKEVNAVADNFYDLFGDTYHKSRRLPNPLRHVNIPHMQDLLKISLSDACASTVAFFKRMANIHIMPDIDKANAFSTEASASKFLSSLK